ncbi:hypothetical protein JXB41_05380 [Candidatus Woesearchaeota archaeon]|nr:hypothetical protein [Candidatus Woesearchaeota archaeon]
MGFEKRGRPTYSVIRQNIIEILYYLGKGYGYDIYKIYRAVFPKITLRSIYYHLNKGITLGEFKIEKIEKEKGDYSWGETAEKVYYVLGKNAKPKGYSRIKEYLSKENGK